MCNDLDLDVQANLQADFFMKFNMCGKVLVWGMLFLLGLPAKDLHL